MTVKGATPLRHSSSIFVCNVTKVVEGAIFGVNPYKLIPEFQHFGLDPAVFRNNVKGIY